LPLDLLFIGKSFQVEIGKVSVSIKDKKQIITKRGFGKSVV